MPDAPERWWDLPPEAVCARLGTDPVRGLEPAEAARRLARDGPNLIPEPPPEPAWRLWLRQFQSPLVMLLVPAAAVSAALGDAPEAAAIAAIVAMNAVLGYAQERRSQRALAALKELSAPRCKAVRGGALSALAAAELVVGDLVALEAGDRLPADGRLLEGADLRVSEASLTGESVPVEKRPAALAGADLPLGERANMLYLGTAAVAGAGRMAVTAVGAATELGAIADALKERPAEATPLEARLAVLGRRLAWVAVGAAVLTAAAGLLAGMRGAEVLLVAVSLAVAAIPEGLPAVVTTGLALGVTRMARRNALIRKLPAVETLGCASVILTDKTGTLTCNEMTATRVWAGGTEYAVSGAGYRSEGDFTRAGASVAPADSPALSAALEAAALASGGEVRAAGGAELEAVGDPTELALLVAAWKAGRPQARLERDFPRLGLAPFDSDRKRMSVLRRAPRGPVLFVKGAPEEVLARSTRWFDGSSERPLDAAARARIQDAAAAQAAGALRVIGAARRDVPEGAAASAALEEDLVFLGLVGLIDPPRPEAAGAVAACRRAGVRVAMVTGDHAATAAAVARAVGLLGGGAVMTGAELERLSEAGLDARLEAVSVYARTSARHKARLVAAWRRRGAVVAVTGDGVNDAPALVEADIGVAMGRTGTDVAKEAADMVVTDDNFASVVSAMEEGRGVYDNIVRVVNYLLSSNLAELMVVLAGLAASAAAGGEPMLPLTAVQILWINLATDGLPALALSFDPLAPGAMERPPRRSQEAIMNGRALIRIILIAGIVSVGSLTAFLRGMDGGLARAQSETLTALVMLQFAVVHAVRRGSGLGLLANPTLLAALAGSLVVQVLALHWPPLARWLGTVPLPAADWASLAGISAAGWAAILAVDRLPLWAQPSAARSTVSR